MKSETSRIVACDKYMDFKCQMSACLDNCCWTGHWVIPIDDATYEKYKLQFDKDNLGHYLRDSIDVGDGKPRFKADANDACMLLTESGLCRIHKNYGIDHLCNVCATFPRSANYYNGYIQAYLSLACPQVTRLFLPEKNGLHFNENKSLKIMRGQIQIPDATAPHVWDESLCYAIREHGYAIIRHKGIPLPVKLFYLGAMIKSLEKDKENAQTVLVSYEANIANRAVSDSIAGALQGFAPLEAPTYWRMIDFLISFLSKKLFSNDKVEFYGRAKKNLAKKEMTDIERMIKVKKDVFDRFFQEREYILENYVIYKMYINLFPYDEKGIVLSFNKLITELMLIMLLFICVYEDKENVETDDLLQCIYIFNRRLVHNIDFLKFMEKFIMMHNDFEYTLLACLNY